MNKEINVSKLFKAEINELAGVQSFVIDSLKDLSLDIKLQNQIKIVLEEIFVNIASYAYDDEGDAEIKIRTENNQIFISFIDSGYEFNPLAKEDPNISAKASERRIGGLGIFMVKNLMDDVQYEYKNKQNILTLVKKY